MARIRTYLVLTAIAAFAFAFPLPASSGLMCFGQPADNVPTSGDDDIVGTPGADVLVGGDGEDVIDGLGGNDRICGGAARDSLFGRGGRDRLSQGGSVAAGALYGGLGDDILRGPSFVLYTGATQGVTVDLAAGEATGQGDDTLIDICCVIGSNHRDVLRGGPGANRLGGAEGQDRLVGRAGSDVLFGASQNDEMYGQNGDDQIYGEGGLSDYAAGGGHVNGDVCAAEQEVGCEKDV